MRIVLLHVPPWKIAPNGAVSYPPGEGPPGGKERPVSGDFTQMPWGLMSLAAQALRAGNDVKLFNISSFPWPEVEKVIRKVGGDLFGMSCFTRNRRGVDFVSRLIRQMHPDAHIAVGGPHVTPLPVETLTHYRALDTVVIGEGEETFLEMIRCLEKGKPVRDIPGTAWREKDDVRLGPPRPRIKDLDTLCSPLLYFPSKILLTSRGCPGRCTYCASNTMWGKLLKFHSVGYVLDMIQTAVQRYRTKFVAIKDDTFTANRKRALAVCRGILERKINFIWSCDTRADSLDEELLYAMRIAGCQRLSLGVESGSPEILKNIRKGITPEKTLEATRLAQKFGFEIRYYLMAKNRGETFETFRQSVDFAEKAGPNQFRFSTLSYFPGTEEFEILRKEKGMSPEIFFKEDFEQLRSNGEGIPPADNQSIDSELDRLAGQRRYRNYSVEEYLEVVKRLPNSSMAHMDLGGAYCRSGRFSESEKIIQRALFMGYPAPGLGLNYFACMAAHRGDYKKCEELLEQAIKLYPHYVVILNRNILENWKKKGGPAGGGFLQLLMHNEFEKASVIRQPEMPAPIDFDNSGKKGLPQKTSSPGQPVKVVLR